MFDEFTGNEAETIHPRRSEDNERKCDNKSEKVAGFRKQVFIWSQFEIPDRLVFSELKHREKKTHRATTV